MSIDVTTLLQSAANPLNGLALFLLVALGAYLADCMFSSKPEPRGR